MLQHDDVYLATGLKAVVLAKSERLNLPPLSFIELWKPEMMLAKFTVRQDAASWLVVERTDGRVRYEIYLLDDQHEGGCEFATTDEADVGAHSILSRRVVMLRCSISLMQQPTAEGKAAK